MRIDRGDLFWLAPEHSGGASAGYSHPHVVVQDDVFNRSRIETVVVSQICSVAKGHLGGRIGALSPARVEQILAGLRFQQRSFFER